MKVVEFNLHMLSQLVRLRSIFHSTMKDLRRNKSWAGVVKYQVATKTQKTKKIIGYYMEFGKGKEPWAKDMEGYVDELQIYFVNSLLDRLMGCLRKGKKLIHSKMSFEVTNEVGLDVPHHNNGFLGVQNAWSFYIPLCKEGTIIFLCDKYLMEVKKVIIPFGCALIVCSNCTMGGYASSKGNITLRRTFSSTQIEIHDDRVQYLVDPWTQKVFSNNNISPKKGL